MSMTMQAMHQQAEPDIMIARFEEPDRDDRRGAEAQEKQESLEYIYSPTLKVFKNLAIERMRAGYGCTLLLEGPPGGGKTSFAKALACDLNATMPYYSGAPDKERDLLYEIDVGGVLRGERAWVPGAAWQAFEASRQGKNAVLLIDEVDKTNTGFDAFLLRLLEDWSFCSPDGVTIQGDPEHLAVILTSNGKRSMRPEVLRRCQRIRVPFPEQDRLIRIIHSIARKELPSNLINAVVRIGNAIRANEADIAPSPKELAFCCVDILALARHSVTDPEIWRQVAASWLIKQGGAEKIDTHVKYKWWRALMTEARNAS